MLRNQVIEWYIFNEAFDAEAVNISFLTACGFEWGVRIKAVLEWIALQKLSLIKTLFKLLQMW